MGKKLIAVTASTAISQGKKDSLAEDLTLLALAIGWPGLLFDFILAFLLINTQVNLSLF
jgi:hypothetical protein